MIQTKTGYEEALKNQFTDMADPTVYRRCEMLLYEEVLRRQGKGHISPRRMFPGYLFIDTDDPEAVHMYLRRIPQFTKVLHMENDTNDGIQKDFIPVETEEWDFLDGLCREGILHVSYIRMSDGGRIEEIIGPLEDYADSIATLDVPHRRAIVTKHILGKDRRLKFGLWTDKDPKIPWIERKKNLHTMEGVATDSVYFALTDIVPGDVVRDTSGTYEEERRFTVVSVDPLHWTVNTTTLMFGREVPIELMLSEVEKS